MKIAIWKSENGELVEKWRFEMGGHNARRIEYENRHFERERIKTLKRDKKEQKKAEKKKTIDEINAEILFENINSYNGSQDGQKEYIDN
ncbi:MAG: hypothetical protein FWE47_00060 [Oscillospiraceae bacterium]|nr:hypothetical protein [Oscillospiraceae bacterium]